jgi:predicted RNA-binding Zn-ribbon protein involved in translation (DUF1610 family)
MRKRPRPPLLMLAILVVGNIPPFTPPGGDPLDSRIFKKRAVCPGCGRKVPARAGGRFYCSNCGDYFIPEGREATTSDEDT